MANYNGTINVTKGHFVSRVQGYMFYKNNAYLTEYVSGSSAGNREFWNMNSYKTIETKTISNCYYYGKGV